MKPTEAIMGLLKRLKHSPEGPEFIEYLEELSKDNYEAFKLDGAEYNDIHKGYAICVDNLLNCFKQCDIDKKIPHIGDWS